jgi:predicted nucleic acid-binding protein
VLDASVTLAWAFEDEAGGYADAALGALAEASALVPALWVSEVVNALVVGERRGRIAPADTARFLALLQSLPVSVAEARVEGLPELSWMAREGGIPAYDASYLQLAVSRGLPLATGDGALREAAASSGVELFHT